ncbi:DUF1697 domain-containing protein [Desulfofustis glycolicus]|uniref:DUF1697 domain-containing protein n=1 Tax=Desulfofustis glycolicus TaxID=51195 RepID=UPI00093235AC|nr:DUF1697 domain-containing protein [Desulfofustis glycolicus]
MEYIALLRGINVGNSVKIIMKELSDLFITLGYTNVSTYINSGNVFFKSTNTRKSITSDIEKGLFAISQSEIKVLVKTKSEIVHIGVIIKSGV